MIIELYINNLVEFIIFKNIMEKYSIKDLGYPERLGLMYPIHKKVTLKVFPKKDGKAVNYTGAEDDTGVYYIFGSKENGEEIDVYHLEKELLAGMIGNDLGLI